MGATPETYIAQSKAWVGPLESAAAERLRMVNASVDRVIVFNC
jgi:hypothetical protein